MKKRRRLVSMLLAALMAFSLTGCGGGGATTAGETTAPAGTAGAGSTEAAAPASSGGEAKDSLVFGIPQEPKYLTAGRSNGQIPNILQTQLYNNLIAINSDGTFSPELATEWEVSADNLTYTFKLRDDVVFHNGEKMTAEDVAFSLDYHAGKLAEYPGGTQAKSFLAYYDKTEIIDDHTIAIHYTDVYGPTMSCLSDMILGILPKKAFEAVGQDEFENHPIGTGPYKFVSKEAGVSITLESNEDYFGGAPAIKNVVFSIRDDTDSAVIALETGELDFLTNIATSYKSTVEGDSNLAWYETDSPGQAWVMFNTGIGTDVPGSKYFSDVRLRQAVAYAVNKDDVVIAATDGLGKVINSPIPDSFAGYSQAPDYYTRDLEKAKALLAEAGYPNGFDVQVRTITTPTYYKLAETLIGQLQEIGINATLEVLETGAYWASVMSDYDYDIAIGNYTATTPDADIPLMQHYYTGAYLNYTNHSIPELDQLLDQARGETDSTKREELYSQIVQIILEKECLVVPVYSFVVTGAGSAALKNVKASPYVDWKIYEWSW
ncbi:ABC transporter substrate-binding protein [Cuneatibacter sp. NSJ-177]|uniref:ABC transporter substrate-binding protein n=1 Tax=Cuneatibacter sp. NSJ-177 TaxID=2931401 RepID=UPI001FD33340|nr:ABC transporter substrate-binding protein [Cuneatibacter sp. NSJ-177]MCJ7833962.1 ABC transporter substrate-binding protein [Cuneatibacter sp. NSJ-177]